MKSHSRLKHSAAGLLGSLISRNNDVNGYWAPGLLYHDVVPEPHLMELDLLTGSSLPPSRTAVWVATSYSIFLRDALAKQGIGWDELTLATVRFQFNAEVPTRYFNAGCAGDPFTCVVTLQTAQGHVATMSGMSRCQPRRQGIVG